MSVDTCLILAAGMGTRMGQFGKLIPKPLWPFFEKTLFDVQYQYAVDLGIKKIYVNAWHLSEQVVNHIGEHYSSADVPVCVVVENELLDVGGAIQNLYYNCMPAHERALLKKLLILNGDQFLFFSNDFYRQAIKLADDAVATLMLIGFNKEDKYNQVVVDSNYNMTNICKNGNYDLSKPLYTYSGVSIINCSFLKKVDGVSQFFQSVANYQQEKVFAISDPKLEYWDFGSKDRYWASMFNLLEILMSKSCYKNVKLCNTSSFVKFVLKHNFIDIKKISDDLWKDLNDDNDVIFAPSIKVGLNNKIQFTGPYSAILYNNNNSVTVNSDGLYFFDKFDPITP